MSAATPVRQSAVLAWAALIASWATLASAGESSLRPRAVVRSLGEASLSSELAARIVSMPFREGEAFRAGDVLVDFDCARMRAEVAAAEAEQAAARVTHEGNREMQAARAIGARELAISAARLDRATAELQAGKARLATCTIRAPFDGFVTERMANENEISAPSSPLLRIVDATRLEIELLAPSRWLAWLKPGDAFTIRIDETGRSYPAVVGRIGAAVDPVSQTVKVFGAFTAPAADIRHGMSGSATFPREPG